ncbi:DUF3987 domain-containing protein [Streptomyces mirabilis]|uniref:DUF3987 domain-containing protein n=1 Tax=Streptomyces mirabilis TaxID=68239 RepID=UPI003628DBA3
MAATYAKHLAGLTLALADWTDPALIQLTPEADAVLLAFQKVTESPLGPDGSFAPIVKWASRRDGAVARIAGLLHLATHPEDGWHRGHEDDSVQSRYDHITPGMWQALMTALTEMWEEALDARRTMSLGSPVAALDALLKAR